MPDARADDTSYLLAHLAVALLQHEKTWPQQYGSELPAGFVELRQMLASAARHGQERPTLDPVAPQVSPAGAMSPLALTYEQTGSALNCSARQVRRLVADGVLPTVKVGQLVRIHTADLEDYLDRQRSRPTPTIPEATA